MVADRNATSEKKRGTWESNSIISAHHQSDNNFRKAMLLHNQMHNFSPQIKRLLTCYHELSWSISDCLSSGAVLSPHILFTVYFLYSGSVVLNVFVHICLYCKTATFLFAKTYYVQTKREHVRLKDFMVSKYCETNSSLYQNLIPNPTKP